MVRRILWTLVISYCTAASAEVLFGARHVLVVDPDKGEVLLDKDSSTVAPIASLTKLMTAMVVSMPVRTPMRLSVSKPRTSIG